MSDYGLLVTGDGVVLVDGEGQALSHACGLCCGGFYRFFPCAIEGVGGGNQNQPCNRAPFPVIYVRSDVMVAGASGGAGRTIGEIVRELSALADGPPTTRRSFEIGISWAGQCYTLTAVGGQPDPVFDLPIEFQPFAQTGRTDTDPYTSDVIVPPVVLASVAASVIPRGEVGAFCRGCLSGLLYCAAYVCSNQPRGSQSGTPEPDGVRYWVCAQVVGAVGNVFSVAGDTPVGSLCFCVDCSQQRDLVEIINAGEQSRILNTDGALTFHSCQHCFDFYYPAGESYPCPDGSICVLEFPCTCTFSGSATVTRTSRENDPRFSQFSITNYRLLADGRVEVRQSVWQGREDASGVPDVFSDWSPLTGLGVVPPLCSWLFCQRVPGEAGALFPFNLAQSLGPAGIDGETFYEDQGIGINNISVFFGLGQCARTCLQSSYGWTSRASASDGGGGSGTIVSQGLWTVSCTCANTDETSVCTRPVTGTATGTPTNATPSLDPRDDVP